jgi:hypothetical protein
MTAHAVSKPTEADAYLSAREQFDFIITQLRSSQAQCMKLNHVEEFLESDGRELLRRLLQGHLNERSPGVVEAPVLDAKGRNHSHLRLQTRSIKTIFGKVELTRAAYGGRDLESLHPLDAELNLPPDVYSYSLRQRVSEEVAKHSYDEAVTSLSKQIGSSMPKRQCQELVERAAQDFESFYQRQRETSAEEVRAKNEILAISSDGKGVLMRISDLREVTRTAALERKPHLKHRLSKGEKTNAKRMATVAAVYTTARFVRTPEQVVRELKPIGELPPERPRPEQKRLWASLKQGAKEVINQAFAEALRRDPERIKDWVMLSDGDRKQLFYLEQSAQEYGVKPLIILDLIHVTERLWSAAWALHSTGAPAAEQWVSVRLLEILHGKSSSVAAGIRRSATLRGLTAEERAPIDKCADYLLKYRDYLHYDQYLAAGYPIATGVIEGACRYLVKDRMEVTGARWSLDGAEAVLRLRALRASGDFDEYWKYHLEQEQQRNHAAHYANSEVPQVLHNNGCKGKASHLRLIK